MEVQATGNVAIINRLPVSPERRLPAVHLRRRSPRPDRDEVIR